MKTLETLYSIIAVGVIFAYVSSSPILVQHTNCKVTLSAYHSLSTGMSYARAVSVLGCPGSEMSRVEMAGYITVMYMWEGNSLGGNMNATFQNDRLVSRAQFGLR